MDVNAVSGAIIDAAMKVHTALGPGLLESVYEACLAHELRSRGLRVVTQAALPVRYEGITLDAGFRVDLLVESVVVVELKAVDAVSPIHEAQLLTYMRLSGRTVGLLINFNVIHLRDGIRRMVHRGPDLTQKPADRAEEGKESSAVPPPPPRPPR